MDRLIQLEVHKIEHEGLPVSLQSEAGEFKLDEQGVPELVWEKGPIEVSRVQQFWPTAPAHGQSGGSSSESRLNLTFNLGSSCIE